MRARISWWFPGTAFGEAALVVESEGGTSLAVNDVIFDLKNRAGLSGWLFKVVGMTGDEPHLPAPVKLRRVKDEAALRAQLEEWSRIPNLKRIIVSHGGIIAEQPAEALRHVAHALAA